MRAALEKVGTKFEIERFAGTHHGFCFVEREIYDRPAAERA
jgi:dienelactone hydrolase